MDLCIFQTEKNFRLSKKNSDAESRRAHLYTLKGMCVLRQEGNKVYATNVIEEEHYFSEVKKVSGSEKKEDTEPDVYMNLPDGEELPFELEKL